MQNQPSSLWLQWRPRKHGSRIAAPNLSIWFRPAVRIALPQADDPAGSDQGIAEGWMDFVAAR
jgi:hypothetical protein